MSSKFVRAQAMSKKCVEMVFAERPLPREDRPETFETPEVALDDHSSPPGVVVGTADENRRNVSLGASVAQIRQQCPLTEDIQELPCVTPQNRDIMDASRKRRRDQRRGATSDVDANFFFQCVDSMLSTEKDFCIAEVLLRAPDLDHGTVHDKCRPRDVRMRLVHEPNSPVDKMGAEEPRDRLDSFKDVAPGSDEGQHQVFKNLDALGHEDDQKEETLAI